MIFILFYLSLIAHFLKKYNFKLIVFVHIGDYWGKVVEVWVKLGNTLGYLPQFETAALATNSLLQFHFFGN